MPHDKKTDEMLFSTSRQMLMQALDAQASHIDSCARSHISLAGESHFVVNVAHSRYLVASVDLDPSFSAFYTQIVRLQ